MSQLCYLIALATLACGAYAGDTDCDALSFGREKLKGTLTQERDQGTCGALSFGREKLKGTLTQERDQGGCDALSFGREKLKGT